MSSFLFVPHCMITEYLFDLTLMFVWLTTQNHFVPRAMYLFYFARENQKEKKQFSNEIEKKKKKKLSLKLALSNGCKCCKYIFDLGHLLRRTVIQQDKNKAKAFVNILLISHSVI